MPSLPSFSVFRRNTVPPPTYPTANNHYAPPPSQPPLRAPSGHHRPHQPVIPTIPPHISQQMPSRAQPPPAIRRSSSTAKASTRHRPQHQNSYSSGYVSAGGGYGSSTERLPNSSSGYASANESISAAQYHRRRTASARPPAAEPQYHHTPAPSARHIDYSRQEEPIGVAAPTPLPPSSQRKRSILRHGHLPHPLYDEERRGSFDNGSRPPSSQQVSRPPSGSQRPPSSSQPQMQRIISQSHRERAPTPTPAPPQAPPSNAIQQVINIGARLRSSSNPVQPKGILKPARARRSVVREDGYQSDKPLKDLVVEECTHGPEEHVKSAKANVTVGKLKHAAVQLQWQLADRTAIKPRKSTHRQDKPLFYWDIGAFPGINNQTTKNLVVKDHSDAHWRLMTNEELKMPVSPHCIVKKMKIKCPALRSWVIRVTASDPNVGVTMKDVFDRVSTSVRKPLTESECEAHQETLNHVQFVEAFKTRCRDFAKHGDGGLEEYQRQRGALRVDLLMGRRIFNGLRQTGEEDWELLLWNQWWEPSKSGH